jgi:LmbE family N-acetylglucosaminyl deacetylase
MNLNGDWSECFRRALVLCAHTDDEIGCAGTILRLGEHGAIVHYVAFSSCADSVPIGFAEDVLVGECQACTEALGIKRSEVEILSFPVRRFPEHRQEVLQKMVELRRQYNPDLVLTASSTDMHQDHTVVYEESFRAFKHTSMLGYEVPCNTRTVGTSAFVAFDKELLEKKIAAIRLYKSQHQRSYTSADFLTGLAKVRGVQCGEEFAEAFEVVRLILR